MFIELKFCFISIFCLIILGLENPKSAEFLGYIRMTSALANQKQAILVYILLNSLEQTFILWKEE